jgi:hypothetical protein
VEKLTPVAELHEWAEYLDTDCVVEPQDNF